MIGQANLQSRIEQLIKNHTFPRFSILVGPKGSGKKTFAHELENMFNERRVISDYVNVYELPDVKIDTIRKAIDSVPESYKKFFLAPLLYEASVHTNTSGVFKGFYKDKNTCNLVQLLF